MFLGSKGQNKVRSQSHKCQNHFSPVQSESVGLRVAKCKFILIIIIHIKRNITRISTSKYYRTVFAVCVILQSNHAPIWRWYCTVVLSLDFYPGTDIYTLYWTYIVQPQRCREKLLTHVKICWVADSVTYCTAWSAILYECCAVINSPTTV